MERLLCVLGATRSFTRREKATVTACAGSSTPSLQDFEVFLQKLIQQGYEVKRGKHTAVKGKEQKINSADELRERATAATERYHAMGDSIKAAETRLAEIAVPRFASWYPPSIWKAI